MPESQEQRDSAVVSSAGDPGPLSRLLQELADASSEGALDAWKSELQPGDRLGRFEIRREVGRGGFGAVYEAFDTELSRVVAVKTLRLSGHAAICRPTGSRRKQRRWRASTTPAS